MLWQVHRIHKKEHDHRTLNSACSHGRFIEHCYTRENTIREHRILHIHCNVLGRFIEHCYTREHDQKTEDSACSSQCLSRIHRALLRKRTWPENRGFCMFITVFEQVHRALLQENMTRKQDSEFNTMQGQLNSTTSILLGGKVWENYHWHISQWCSFSHVTSTFHISGSVFHSGVVLAMSHSLSLFLAQCLTAV